MRRAALLLFVLVAACKREERRFEEIAPLQDQPVTLTNATFENPYRGNAWALAEGSRLFRWFNCSGCHANGGGGMGPALMDAKWIYGSDPATIYTTIADGRPNGMPAFRDRLSQEQIWQLVGYVRSLSGLEPKLSEPGRNDTMYSHAPPSQTKPENPQKTGKP